MKSHLGLLAGLCCLVRLSLSSPDFPTNPAGNPFDTGKYADPDAAYLAGQYWVYATRSQDVQLGFDAFTSPDLIHWTKHTDVLTKNDFSWATQAFFAPSPIAHNGKYYLFFSAQFPIGNGNNLDGIGIGVADTPGGPFKDAINGTIVAGINNNAYSMDQVVFIDDDGQAYMYWGSGGHCNVAMLSDDLTRLEKFPDGTTIKEITPDSQFAEGVYVIKRKGKYYMFWSEGLYFADTYSVAYGISNSPLGPFPRKGKILQTDSAVATGPGHNGIIHVPDTDIYYIVYHRHPLGYTDGNDRVLAYDRLNFNSDGTVQPVQLLVRDDFSSANMIDWTPYGGNWDASSNALVAGYGAGSKTLLNTAFTDVGCDVYVTLASSSGDAGLLFRVSNPVTGQDGYQGYYAGISASGYVVLGRANNNTWTQLAKTAMSISANKAYLLRVRAKGTTIEVLVNDMSKSVISVQDGTYSKGKNGVRVFGTGATFDNVVFEHI